MAIIHKCFLGYLSTVLTNSMDGRKSSYIYDPLFALLAIGSGYSVDFSECNISEKNAKQAPCLFRQSGLIGVMMNYFKDGVIDQFTDEETERQVIALKSGFGSLPATTCSIIMRGLKKELSDQDVLRIYASHGLTQGMRELAAKFDFTDINRRAREFAVMLEDKQKQQVLVQRCEAMLGYVQATSGKREMAIRKCGMKRSLFFHYWKRFGNYGLLGLADSGAELFRKSKIGLRSEARMVIDKLQHPRKSNISFVEILETKDIHINPSAVSKIFQRWRINDFDSEFTDNLKRLETDFSEEIEPENLLPVENPIRLVDKYYQAKLQGMTNDGMPTDSPGLFIIWAYLERLGIFPILSKMGLASLQDKPKGYSWFDLLLFNIARIFYGIPSHTAACEHPEPSLAFFAGLIKAPCNDTFLDGLEMKITEKETFQLRQWLVGKSYEHNLIDFRKTALDFHQIDMDVIFDKLRKFGKGPSPAKKICYNGFRPHIAWDVGTGCLIVAEFRKSSARGTTTAIPFIKDFMLPEFSELFETIYIDSEYTGKNVWQFVLDSKGMNAELTACLKQNSFVKKERDVFLQKNQNEAGFWKFYDDQHVYSSKTFELCWQNKSQEENKTFKLNCVVKKNIGNGSLRCFGTSKSHLDPERILMDYSSRWVIENGIKDLIGSYFMDNCPGTRPHLADVHFLIISICRILFKMLTNDLGEDCKNPDGTVKTLARMREVLFRQGAGIVRLKNDTFEIEFLNSFSTSMTRMLNKLFNKKSGDYTNGLDILGGPN